MTKTFTENDLVRFLYGELNEQETEELKDALVTDTNLQSKLNDLRLVVKDLDGLRLSPSQSTVDKILAFSRGFHKASV